MQLLSLCCAFVGFCKSILLKWEVTFIKYIYYLLTGVRLNWLVLTKTEGQINRVHP